jgi:hypothetical protein
MTVIFTIVLNGFLCTIGLTVVSTFVYVAWMLLDLEFYELHVAGDLEDSEYPEKDESFKGVFRNPVSINCFLHLSHVYGGAYSFALLKFILSLSLSLVITKFLAKKP